MDPTLTWALVPQRTPTKQRQIPSTTQTKRGKQNTALAKRQASLLDNIPVRHSISVARQLFSGGQSVTAKNLGLQLLKSMTQRSTLAIEAAQATQQEKQAKQELALAQRQQREAMELAQQAQAAAAAVAAQQQTQVAQANALVQQAQQQVQQLRTQVMAAQQVRAAAAPVLAAAPVAPAALAAMAVDGATPSRTYLPDLFIKRKGKWIRQKRRKTRMPDRSYDAIFRRQMAKIMGRRSRR